MQNHKKFVLIIFLQIYCSIIHISAMYRGVWRVAEYDFDILIKEPQKIFSFCQKITTIMYALSFIFALWRRESFSNFLNVLRSDDIRKQGTHSTPAALKYWVSSCHQCILLAMDSRKSYEDKYFTNLA